MQELLKRKSKTVKRAIKISEVVIVLFGIFALVSGIYLFVTESILRYMIIEMHALILGVLIVLFLIIFSSPWKKVFKFLGKTWVWASILVVVFFVGMFANATYKPHFALPAWMQTKAPHGPAAAIPVPKVFEFFDRINEMEFVNDIGADPNDVPKPITRDEPALIEINIEAQEVIAELADGIYFNYWTYNQQVPGPMFRVREGDDVIVNLTNHESSLHPHNIDLHAVTGPGGGATLSTAKPGETKSFKWKALNPGLYVYHCATPNISTHNAHGQYGLILVEPEEGLPEVDREFYIVQGELYTQGRLGKKGLVAFDSKALLDGIPNYVTFNGKVEDEPRMEVNAGDSVRMYVGNGGVNLISSFHVIGEIFDRVYPEAAIGKDLIIDEEENESEADDFHVHKNVQTTTVLPGGASIVEFVADVPGNLILVDHALARMNKGAWSILKVIGEDRPDIYSPFE